MLLKSLWSPTYAKILQSQSWSPVLLSLISAYLPVLWTLILEHVYNTIQGGWTMFNLSTKNKVGLMTWNFVVAKAHDACTSWRYLVAKLLTFMSIWAIFHLWNREAEITVTYLVNVVIGQRLDIFWCLNILQRLETMKNVSRHH